MCNFFLGIVWQKDADVIIACSKDKHVYHHVMADAERPAEKANPVALSISPQGFVAHSFPNLMQKPSLKSKYVLGFYLRSKFQLASTNYEILRGVFFLVGEGVRY